eukprot:2975579-Pleurochrysis_carterae.AAC.1
MKDGADKSHIKSSEQDKQQNSVLRSSRSRQRRRRRCRRLSSAVFRNRANGKRKCENSPLRANDVCSLLRSGTRSLPVSCALCAHQRTCASCPPTWVSLATFSYLPAYVLKLPTCPPACLPKTHLTDHAILPMALLVQLYI